MQEVKVYLTTGETVIFTNPEDNESRHGGVCFETEDGLTTFSDCDGRYMGAVNTQYIKAIILDEYGTFHNF